jgi:anti-repressor protein
MTGGGKQEVRIISEPDVLRLIVSCNLPIGVKMERWIFEEVIPSIRKHGAYMTPEVIEKTLLNPDFIIRLATELKTEKEKRIAAEAKIEADKESTELGNVLRYNNAIAKTHRIANVLFNIGIDIGRTRLHDHLRSKGLMNKNDAMLSQRALDMGIGQNVVTGKWEHVKTGITHLSYTAFLNYKGIKMLFDDFGVSPQVQDVAMRDLTDEETATNVALHVVDKEGNKKLVS